VRALSVALKLTDQARVWKTDKNFSNPLTDQALGLLGHDAVLTITGCRTPVSSALPDAAIMQASEVPGAN